MSGTPGVDREAEEQLLALLEAAKVPQTAVGRLPDEHLVVGVDQVARVLGCPRAATSDLISSGAIPHTATDDQPAVLLGELRAWQTRERARQRAGMNALADFQDEHGLVD